MIHTCAYSRPHLYILYIYIFLFQIINFRWRMEVCDVLVVPPIALVDSIKVGKIEGTIAIHLV